MKASYFFFALASITFSSIFANNSAGDHIARAQRYIGSIQNYKGHKVRANSITNNRPGIPGVVDAYQKQQQVTQTKNIDDAKRKAQEELTEAKKTADTQQQKTIQKLKRELTNL